MLDFVECLVRSNLKLITFNTSNVEEQVMPAGTSSLDVGGIWARCVASFANHGLVCIGGRAKGLRMYRSWDGGLVRTLPTRGDMVRAVTQVSDEVMCVADGDGTLALWGIKSGNLMARTHVAASYATSIAKIDDQRFAVGAQTGQIFVYWHDGAMSLQESARLPSRHHTMVWSVAVHNELLVSTSEDGSVLVYNLNKRCQVNSWSHPHAVTACAINERYIATASLDMIQVRRRNSAFVFNRLWKGLHPDSWIHALKFASSDVLVSGGANGMILCTRVSTEEVARCYRVSLDAVWGVDVLPDKRIVVCGAFSSDSYIISTDTTFEIEQPPTSRFSIQSFRRLRTAGRFSN